MHVRSDKRLSDIALVAATLAVLPLTVFTLWMSGWYSGVGSRTGADPRLLEREGIVWRLDVGPAAETLHVSTSRSGFDALAVALTPHTLILVGDREGGVSDLGKGVRIRVVYQRREARLVALCVEFLNPEGESPIKGCRSNTVLHRLAPGSV